MSFTKMVVATCQASGYVENLTSHLLETYGIAGNIGCISEDLALQHVSFLLQLRKLRSIFDNYCTKTFPDAVQLWALKFSLEMRCTEDQSHLLNKENLSLIFGLLTNVLNKVAVSKAEHLWVMEFKYFAPHKQFFDKLVETSVMMLTKYGGSDEGFCLSSTIVNNILQRDGIQNAREIYRRFLGLPRPGLSLYRTCIELELNIASTGSKDCTHSNARKLFEAALTTDNKDVSLWQEYIIYWKLRWEHQKQQQLFIGEQERPLITTMFPFPE